MFTSTTGIATRAGAWFLQSGIVDEQGGVARYYNLDAGRNALVSTEITGYTISTLAFLYSSTGRTEFLDNAIRCGRFLCRKAWDSRLRIFPFEYPSQGKAPEPLGYFFDSGIICRALLSLWRVTGDPEFLDIATQCASGMAIHFAPRDGDVPPVVRLPELEPLPYEKRWSREPGCYQLKAALAWLEAGEAAADDSYCQHYERLLERSLQTHRDFLPGSDERSKVMDRLHAYCYFLEALLPRVERPDVQAALEEGIDRVSFFLRDISPEFARSDVYAQLLRVRLFAASAGIPLDETAAAEEAACLESFQFESADRRLDGAFCFGRKQGEWMPFANPVSTGFACQALALYQQYLDGHWKAAWQDLI